MAISYRKTKDGKWVAFGPVAEVRVGTVTVTKASGERKTEQVVSLGKPFEANGTQCVYGYLATSAPAPARRPSVQSGRRYECPECGDYVYPGTSCWETGCTH